MSAQIPTCQCGESSAYTRKYSGESLCKDCFLESIQKKVAKTISRHSMILRGQRVCVGVSGGKDSLSLLNILDKLSKKWTFEIIPVTVDEGIPGYRDEALSIVEKYCSSLGYKHHTVSYKDLFGTTLDDALESRTDSRSSCSICGVLRRRALDVAAADLNVDSIATGHNLDDMVQTMLMNTMSGNTARIPWMNPDATQSEGIRRIKPFCDIYESEIVFYAYTAKIPFQTEQCPHMGEGIRTEVRQFLNALEAKHSGIKNNMYRSFVEISQDMRKVATQAKPAKCNECGATCSGSVCAACSALARLDPNSMQI